MLLEQSATASAAMQSLARTPHDHDERLNVLVVGMGTYPFGKERRAVNALSNMRRVHPYFLLSEWGDDSVPDLLRQHQLDFGKTSFGYLGFRRPDWTLKNVARMPRLLLTVVRAFARRRCHAVLLLGLREFLNALPAFVYLRFMKGGRLIFYLGDVPSNNFVYRRLSRLAERLGAAIVVNSETVKRGLVSLGASEERIRVIYNGVDIDRFQNARPLTIREDRSWSAEDVLIGYLGQFRENKGVRDFVEAADLVLARNKRCRFVMTGPLDPENTCLQELQAYVRNRELSEYFAFTGRVDAVERVYAALDVVAVPSRHEDPAPNVNLEAMASGVPVIGTRAGGTPELLAPGETGVLVEPGRPRELAAQILKMASDPELRRRIGAAGLLRVKARFDVRMSAQLVESVLIESI